MEVRLHKDGFEFKASGDEELEHTVDWLQNLLQDGRVLECHHIFVEKQFQKKSKTLVNILVKVEPFEKQPEKEVKTKLPDPEPLV